MLALIAMAMFSGVTQGYDDLAQYAATLSQGQLRALKFRLDPPSRRVRCPQASAFAYVLAGVDAARFQRALLAWQEQVLGPTQDRLVILDGKSLRHAGGETVNAVSGAGGRRPRGCTGSAASPWRNWTRRAGGGSSGAIGGWKAGRITRWT
jgi:hypothetical protein